MWGAVICKKLLKKYFELNLETDNVKSYIELLMIMREFNWKKTKTYCRTSIAILVWSRQRRLRTVVGLFLVSANLNSCIALLDDYAGVQLAEDQKTMIMREFYVGQFVKMDSRIDEMNASIRQFFKSSIRELPNVDYWTCIATLDLIQKTACAHSHTVVGLFVVSASSALYDHTLSFKETKQLGDVICTVYIISSRILVKWFASSFSAEVVI